MLETLYKKICSCIANVAEVVIEFFESTLPISPEKAFNRVLTISNFLEIRGEQVAKKCQL